MYPNLLILWKFYVVTSFTIHFTLCFIFRVWPYHFLLYIYIYICIYNIYIMNEFITLWTRMFNETVSKDTEMLFPSLGLIKHMALEINCIMDTEQTSENICHMYLWHTKCLNVAEVRWSLGTWCIWSKRSFLIA